MDEYFNFDLHLHTIYSKDSLLSPKNIIKVALAKNINAIGVTDHNTILGGLKAKSFESDSLIVVIGSEVSTDYGDLIGLFLNEEIKTRVFSEVIDEIKDQGGLVVLPHPYRRKKFPNNEILKKIDVIEGVNGRTSKELNLKAQSLAKMLNKPIIGGSDSHFSFEIGSLINQTCYFCNNEEELRKNLLNNKSICLCQP